MLHNHDIQSGRPVGIASHRICEMSVLFEVHERMCPLCKPGVDSVNMCIKFKYEQNCQDPGLAHWLSIPLT